MGEIYGGHLVARHLVEVEKIDTVFSLSGGHIDRIYDGFLQYNVKLIDVRHEQAAAMAAHAWSVYTKKPGVCLFTAGPGFTNALTGVVNASLENVPLVVISGTAPVRDWQKGALQEMDQKSMIASSAKWHATCYDTKRIPEYISRAFSHAVSGRPGPVYLELPPDILNVKVEESLILPQKSGQKPYVFQAAPDDIDRAVELIDAARRPLILGGNGCAKAAEALGEFVKKTNIPFFLANTGRGALPDEHPLSLWDGGLMGAMSAIASADLVLVLGIKFDWMLLFGQGFDQAKVVRIDIEPTEIDRNRIADVGLVGDMSLVIRQLVPAVKTQDHSDWLATLKQTNQAISAEDMALAKKPSDPIHPVRLVAQIRKAIGDDAAYVVDGGDTSYFGLMGLRAKTAGSVVGSAGGLFGCLGTGVPFALGAKTAMPNRTVVVISGDGSFGFNAMEFDTAVRHNLPFVCVIVNDQAWGMIKHGQEICYGDQRIVGSELGVVHYEQVVQALGGYGEMVEKDEDIIPAIHRALDSNKPACINVLTDPCVTSPATLMFSDSLKME